MARAAIVTTLLCIVPPSVGSGWQTMPTRGSGATSSSGRSTCSSSAPAGPAMATGPDASGSGGLGLGDLGGLAMRGMIGACTRLRMVALPRCDPGQANFDEPGRCCGLMQRRLRDFPGAVFPGLVLPEWSVGGVCQNWTRRPVAGPWTFAWTVLRLEVGLA